MAGAAAGLKLITFAYLSLPPQRSGEAPAGGHQHPCDPRHLVRESDGDDIIWLLREQFGSPLRRRRFAIPAEAEDRVCTDDEKPPDVGIALLAEPAEALLSAGRALSRHEAARPQAAGRI